MPCSSRRSSPRRTPTSTTRRRCRPPSARPSRPAQVPLLVVGGPRFEEGSAGDARGRPGLRPRHDPRRGRLATSCTSSSRPAPSPTPEERSDDPRRGRRSPSPTAATCPTATPTTPATSSTGRTPSRRSVTSPPRCASAPTATRGCSPPTRRRSSCAPVRAGDVIEIEARARARRNPFPRDGVRGARRRPGRPRARRVRRRRARPAGGGDHRPWGRGGALGCVTYRWRVPTPLRYAARPAAAVAAGLCLWLAFPEADLWWLAPVGVALLAAATLTAGARQRCPAGPARRAGLLRARAVVVGRLRRRAALVRAGHPRGALHRRHVGRGRLRRYGGSPPPGTRSRPTSSSPLAWVVQEWARGATPYGGFPWARLAFSQADSPLAHVAALARGARGDLRRGGRRHAAASPRRPSAAHRVLASVPRGPRSSPVALVAVAPLADPAAHRRSRQCPSASSRATCRRPGSSSTPSAGPCSTTTSTAPSSSPPRRRRTTSTSSSGRRTPPTSTRCATPTPPPQIDERPHAPSGCRCSSARVLAEPPGFSSNVVAVLPARRGPSRSATSSCTRCRSPSTSRAAPSSGIFTPMADLAGNFVAGDEIGVFRCRAAGR